MSSSDSSGPGPVSGSGPSYGAISIPSDGEVLHSTAQSPPQPLSQSLSQSQSQSQSQTPPSRRRANRTTKKAWLIILGAVALVVLGVLAVVTVGER